VMIPLYRRLAFCHCWHIHRSDCWWANLAIGSAASWAIDAVREISRFSRYDTGDLNLDDDLVLSCSRIPYLWSAGNVTGACIIQASRSAGA
jgi:hypothetical protein